MKSNFLHIGYHKTGTTWMQKFLFPTVFGDDYLGKYLEEQRSYEDLLPQLKNQEDKFISNEWFMKQYDTITQLSSTLYTTLKNFAGGEKPNTKIIVSIRRQADIFASRHTHQEHKYDFKLWDTDLKLGVFALKSITPMLFNYYNFFNTYKQFTEHFGNNIHVIIYENLFNNTSHEIDRFLNFIEKNIETDQKKTIEKNNAKVINKAARSLNKEERNMLPIIQKVYEESNKRLSSLIDFDLSQYGYHK